MKNGVIILASARKKGNTQKVVSALNMQLNFEILDLLDYSINPYSYQPERQKDDFIELIEKVVAFDTIIMASPVYWYSMSGLLKNFLDRISDCLVYRKDIGYAFKGKSLATICCSSNEEEYPEYVKPFERTADYLGMSFIDHIHTWVEDDGSISDDVRMRIEKWTSKIRG